MNQEEYINYINNNCGGDKCCTDYDCQVVITDQHKITSTEMDTMVTSFFGNIPEFFCIPAESLDLDAAPCSDLLLCDYDTQALTNSDITINIGTGTATTTYSVALFKGLRDIYSPEAFYFSKAKNATGAVTLVFRGTSPTARVVYCGDMSQETP